MKVIGAGFGRTGTKSLQEALEILGYNKSYHMVTLFTNPDDIKYWEDAAQERVVDWDSLFNGYEAVVDFPGSLFYKELLKKYPESKIILTVRDAEKWYESTYSTIYSFSPDLIKKIQLALTAIFSKRARNLLRVVKLNNLTIWKNLFKERFKDRDFAIEIFNSHTEDTIKYVPAHQLLVFKVEDGWEPLCRFLDKPIPNIPFPKANNKEEFKIMTAKFLDI
ncbi:MAG: hypothetical protein M9958_00645 [Chitinophagales bacterium]|nr:hypothetical protein [Chitinophagales bacterium]